MSAGGFPPGQAGGFSPGQVVLVGTPIGNLGDLTERAKAVLAAADVVFCEDTRRTRTLYAALGIKAPRLVSLHKGNERSEAAKACHLASQGQLVAVATDAGMPGVSDPGEAVVEAAREAGVQLGVAPGVSAPTTAVALLGVGDRTEGRWCFEGFLPRSGSARKERIAALVDEPRAAVIFEAPHRIGRTLEDLAAACGGERRVGWARELTKLNEQTWSGTLGQAVEQARSVEPRGEYVLVLYGAPPRQVDDQQIRLRLEELVGQGMSKRDAVDAVVAELRVAHRRAYKLALEADTSG